VSLHETPRGRADCHGSEVARGRIEDRFTPLLRKKVEALGCTVNNETIVADDANLIAAKIRNSSKGQ